jgi:hypothetical protein
MASEYSLSLGYDSDDGSSDGEQDTEMLLGPDGCTVVAATSALHSFLQHNTALSERDAAVTKATELNVQLEKTCEQLRTVSLQLESCEFSICLLQCKLREVQRVALQQTTLSCGEQGVNICPGSLYHEAKRRRRSVHCGASVDYIVEVRRSFSTAIIAAVQRGQS